MKNINIKLAFAVLMTGFYALADIKAPAQLNCTVKSVTPVDAVFFGFGPGPKLGDTTRLDLDAQEIQGISFASGAHIGSTQVKHPLVKAAKSFNNHSFHEANFTSKHTRHNYRAVLVAYDDETNQKIQVSLDVTETQNQGRIHLNSLDLICTR